MKMLVLDPTSIVALADDDARRVAILIEQASHFSELHILSAVPASDSLLSTKLTRKIASWQTIATETTSSPVWLAVLRAREIGARYIFSVGISHRLQLSGNAEWAGRNIAFIPDQDLADYQARAGTNRLRDVLRGASMLCLSRSGTRTLRETIGDEATTVVLHDGAFPDLAVRAMQALVIDGHLPWIVGGVVKNSETFSAFEGPDAVCGAYVEEAASSGIEAIPLSAGWLLVDPEEGSCQLVVPTNHAPSIGNRRRAWLLRELVQHWGFKQLFTDDAELLHICYTHEAVAPYVTFLFAPARPASNSIVDSELHKLGKLPIPVVVWQTDTIVEVEDLLPASVGKVYAPSSASTLTYRYVSKYLRTWGSTASRPKAANRPVRIVVAGHDLKFATLLIRTLFTDQTFEVAVDVWPSQHQRGARTDQLLNWADIVWVEFASTAASWYAARLPKRARLIVRAHGYEVDGAWGDEIDWGRVDTLICVSEHLKERALGCWSVPEGRVAVIPNAIDALELARSKRPDANLIVGILGWTPSLKRIDHALDLISSLRKVDSRFSLSVKGTFPTRNSWFLQTRGERLFFAAVEERLRSDASLLDAVSFENASAAVSSWLQSVGWITSFSDRESFHLAAVEGMASGAVPLVLERTGVHSIFPKENIFDNTASAAEFVLDSQSRCDFDVRSTHASELASRFDVVRVRSAWLSAIKG